MHDYKERFYVETCLEDSEPERRMRAQLRELTTRMFRQSWAPAETWWFVLKARRPFGTPRVPRARMRQGFDWTALDPGVRAQIRRHAHARWRQEVVVEVAEDAEGAVGKSVYWLQVFNRFSFKRVPRSVVDTEPLLTVTFSTRMDPAPYNLSASEQDSLCAQMEKTFCWTGVRQIRLIRFIDARDRVTDTYKHNFTVQLVVEPSEQTADRHVQDDAALEVITAPEEFTLHISDLEPHAGFFEPGHPNARAGAAGPDTAAARGARPRAHHGASAAPAVSMCSCAPAVAMACCVQQ
jgi:hypothetical protein